MFKNINYNKNIDILENAMMNILEIIFQMTVIYRPVALPHPFMRDNPEFDNITGKMKTF